ncbi:MAG TPA: hypothetical protein DHW82_03420 [Spirochaetia bacterium]|nr:MAG: hypothetical protein A2Y41_12870 [Spirochaetes bacterium GWB1_36_13]HCL56042.1 hypothetical protein [Spirochaetia bacterium]
MIDIQPTATSPRVYFKEHTLSIEGESYPENSFAFYKPLLEWFASEFPQWDKFELHLRINYMNSSSVKCLLDILNILEKAHQSGKTIKVIWFYEKDNNRSFELAEEFQEDLELPFEISAE